jgi:hypothetical protein
MGRNSARGSANRRRSNWSRRQASRRRRKATIVIWDNRCSYHKAAGDYPPEEDRIHWRVSINDYGVEAQAAAE